MDRRAFLRILGLSPIFCRGLLRDLAAAELPVVAVAEGQDHARITRSAIAALGGMARFVKPGATVVVAGLVIGCGSPCCPENSGPRGLTAVHQQGFVRREEGVI